MQDYHSIKDHNHHKDFCHCFMRKHRMWYFWGGGVEFCPESSCPGSVRIHFVREYPEYSIRKCPILGVSGIFCAKMSCPRSVRNILSGVVLFGEFPDPKSPGMSRHVRTAQSIEDIKRIPTPWISKLAFTIIRYMRKNNFGLFSNNYFIFENFKSLYLFCYIFSDVFW